MLIATPVRVYLLSILPEMPTRWLVLTLIMIASLLLLKGYRLEGSESGRRLTFGVGLLSAWVNGTTAVGGLPIALLTFPLLRALLFHGHPWSPTCFTRISSRWDFPD